MTPAKLVALAIKRRERLFEQETPLTQLAWMYANANRFPGEWKDGQQIKPPAPAMPFEDFRTMKLFTGTRKPTEIKLGGEHNWRGAVADIKQFTGPTLPGTRE